MSQWWSLLYLNHLHSLFLSVFLCCFSSSVYQGVGFLCLTLTSLVDVTKLRVLSITWFRWLTASSSVVICMIRSMLMFSQNLCIVFSLIFLIFCPLILVLGFISMVSSITNLWSDMYGPAVVLVGWKGTSSAGVIMTSRVWPFLCVGIFMCYIKLNATSESSNIYASWSSMLSLCMLISPSMIMFWDVEDNTDRRWVNWSRNIELLLFAWQLDWVTVTVYVGFNLNCTFHFLCSKLV